MDNHKEVYLAHFYIAKHGQMDILEEPMGKQVKGHQIVGWTTIVEGELTTINLGIFIRGTMANMGWHKLGRRICPKGKTFVLTILRYIYMELLRHEWDTNVHI